MAQSIGEFFGSLFGSFYNQIASFGLRILFIFFIGYLAICAVALVGMGIVKLIQFLWKRHKKKQELPQPSFEDQIPDVVKRSATSCPKCGANVPLFSQGHMVMFCPFCSAPLADATKIVDQTYKNQKDKRDYEIRMKELQEKVKAQELEKERYKVQRAEHISQILKIAIPCALGALFLIVLVIATR